MERGAVQAVLDGVVLANDGHADSPREIWSSCLTK
jgi:hypothetical protein